jgi:HlyD family secretion protein
VQVEVSESDILKLERGNRAEVEVDAYLNRIFKGVISEISNTAINVAGAMGASLNTDQVTNFTVKIRLDPSSYQDLVGVGKKYPFRPGMSASVDIFAKTVENALTVPIIAVTARDPDLKKKDTDEEQPKEADKQKQKALKELVFVMEGDTVRESEVKIGIQDNDFIEILSGLKEGDMVVNGPYSAITRTLENGNQVHIKVEEKSGKSWKDKK